MTVLRQYSFILDGHPRWWTTMAMRKVPQLYQRRVLGDWWQQQRQQFRSHATLHSCFRTVKRMKRSGSPAMVAEIFFADDAIAYRSVPSPWLPLLSRRWYGSRTITYGHAVGDPKLPAQLQKHPHHLTSYTRFQLELLQEQMNRVRELVDETKFPLQSFREKQFIHTRVAFKQLKKMSRWFLEMENAAETLNLIFDVLERLAKEFPYHNQPKPTPPPTEATFTDDEMEEDDDDEKRKGYHHRAGASITSQYQWLLGHTQVPHYVHIWKKMALDGHPVYRAREVLVKIQTMVQHYPDCQFDVKVYGVILGVLMKQEDPQLVPDWAEVVFKFVQNLKDPNVQPDIFLYNQLIQSWAAASQRVEAAGKVSEWYARMRQEFCPNNPKSVRPDIVTYTVLHRFWGKMGDTHQLDCLFRDMRHDNIAPNIICLNGAIYGYAGAGEIDKAQDLLQQLVPMRPENQSQIRMISESAQRILLACRDKIERRNENNASDIIEERDRIVEQAEAVFQLVADKVDHRSRDGLFCTLVDAFIKGGKYEKFESILQELNPSNKIHLALLMKYYVRTDQAEKAILLLKERLEVDPMKIDLEIFHNFINELAKCSIPTAYEHACQVLKLLDETDGIEANQSTFLCLFKCLSNSKVEAAGKRAKDLLIEMDGRSFTTGKAVETENDRLAVTMALNIALDFGETDTAEELLEWIGQSKHEISTKVYNVILNDLAERRSVAAARKVEEILNSMKRRESSTMQPDIQSYTALIKAWALSGANYAGQRVLLIHQQMQSEKINLDLAAYDALIEALSSCRSPEMLIKAENILQNLEDSLLPSVQPNSRHYSTIMKAWVAIGDALSAQRLMERQINYHIKKRTRVSRPVPAHYLAIAKAFTRTGDLVGATAFVEKIQKLKDEGSISEGPSFQLYDYLQKAWSASNNPGRDDQISRIDKIINIKFTDQQKQAA